MVVIILIGLIVIGLGFTVLVSPKTLQGALRLFIVRQLWFPITLIRVVIGILLILVASKSRVPPLITGVGILFVLSGTLLPMLGTGRIEKVARWWLDRPNTLVRLWGLLAATLGALMLWAGWPL